MLKRMKVSRSKRVLVRTGRHYQVMGPGKIWLNPRQHIITTINVGPQEKSFTVTKVQTVEKVPLDVTIQVLYRIDPDLFSDDLLHHLQKLNEGGWQSKLHWHFEYVLRQLLADYGWRDLDRFEIKERLERQLTQTLADRLKGVGINITATYLIKAELPEDLQQTIIQTEQNEVEARGRATILKEYFELFGNDLSQAMPYVMQWEMLNTMHKNGGNPQFLMTASNPSLDASLPGIGTSPVFRMDLPVIQEKEDVPVN